MLGGCSFEFLFNECRAIIEDCHVGCMNTVTSLAVAVWQLCDLVLSFFSMNDHCNAFVGGYFDRNLQRALEACLENVMNTIASVFVRTSLDISFEFLINEWYYICLCRRPFRSHPRAASTRHYRGLSWEWSSSRRGESIKDFEVRWVVLCLCLSVCWMTHCSVIQFSISCSVFWGRRGESRPQI